MKKIFIAIPGRVMLILALCFFGCHAFADIEPNDSFANANIQALSTLHSGCQSYTLGNFCANVPEVAISFEGDQNLCPGDSLLLTATAGLDGYSWLQDGEEVSTEQTYLATDAGTYQVVGIDANGCDGLSDEVVIGVFDVPELSISAFGPVDFCHGDVVTLSANSGFDSYLWSSGQTFSSIYVYDSGIFSVTATTDDGCDAVSSNTIEVSVYLDDDNDGVCEGTGVCSLLDANVGDTCDDGNSGTYNDVINSWCVCQGSENPFDCPIFYVDFGDDCDDMNPNTENDVYNEDCECEGSAINAPLSILLNINSSCAPRDVSIKLYEAGTTNLLHIYDTTVAASGDFNLPVAIGTFDIFVKVEGYLQKGMGNVSISSSSQSSISFGDLDGGDINNDNVINILDVSSVNAAFGSSIGDSNYSELADFNCDGNVNILDVSGLNANFGNSGMAAPISTL